MIKVTTVKLVLLAVTAALVGVQLGAVIVVVLGR
jgi:hypothetical protein